LRRKEKQIQDQAELESIISRAQICRLAMTVDNRPYLVPLSFGYDSNTLYFHSASEGRKLEMIKENPQVCFELEATAEVISAERACNWGLEYESIIGSGRASLIEDLDEKKRSLDLIMKQYSKEDWEYPQRQLEKTVIFKVTIEEMTGKKSK
jgi:uncharacterized protein